MKLYVMLAFTRDTQRPNTVLLELFERLEQRGCAIEIGIGSELILEPDSLRVNHDLYLLKSHTAWWLSVAGILHGLGANILNPYTSCMLAHDKIQCVQRLRASGIPVPHSWMAGDLDLLRAIVAQRMVVIKPYNGRRGVEVRTVRDLAELARISPPTLPTLVQDYVPGDELKVYVIGEQVFGIRKFYTATGSTRVPGQVSDEARTIALRCGQIFGLGLYGLDLIESDNGPVVIDLNYFPSYKGIPGAASALADYVYTYSDSSPLAPADISNNRKEETTPAASRSVPPGRGY